MVVAFVALLPWRVTGATCSVAPGVNYPAGHGIHNVVVVADVNNDGTNDLAIATVSSNVSILLGNVDGTFAAAVNYGVDGTPYSLAIGDINRDGTPDLVAAGSKAVFVLLGNGDGSFAAAVSYTLSTGPAAVAIGDLNSDGEPDLAVANANSTAVSILLGTGNGALAPAITCAVSVLPKTVSASTVSFTDEPLTATTLVKAIHVTELRAAIDGLRARHPISPFVYADSLLNPASTHVRATHFVELRSALDAVYDALGITRPLYTDPTLTAGATTIKRLHVEQIRNAVRGAESFILTVSRSGAGSGTVTSVPAGVSCGSACTKHYLPGTAVTLTAAPAAGSVFAGWSGSCAGTGTCQVPMSADTAVTATFALPQVFTLTVTTIGTGSGTVTSSPAGISCGVDCSEGYNAGTSVTLSPSAPAGSYFVGWGGACGGNGECIVPMTSNAAVVAQFGPMAAIDVQPRNIDMGTVRPCDGGVLGAHFTVNAPANVNWSVTWAGSDSPPQAELSATSGTGPGGVNFLVTVPSQTPSGSFTCADYTNMGRGDSFIFTFISNSGQYAGQVFTGVTWTFPYLP